MHQRTNSASDNLYHLEFEISTGQNSTSLMIEYPHHWQVAASTVTHVCAATGEMTLSIGKGWLTAAKASFIAICAGAPRKNTTGKSPTSSEA